MSDATPIADVGDGAHRLLRLGHGIEVAHSATPAIRSRADLFFEKSPPLVVDIAQDGRRFRITYE